MDTTIELTNMRAVHEMATAEFGNMAADLEHGDRLQPIYLPGGRFALVITPASPDTVEISKAVGDRVEGHAGLGEFLLREHRMWTFGRFELLDATLVVSHTVHASTLTNTTLRECVLAVHSRAVAAEGLLAAAGALVVDDSDDGDD